MEKRGIYDLVEKEYKPTLLYKGLDISAFSYYFQNGGIAPNHSPTYPHWRWITSDWKRAYGHLKHISIPDSCLAIIDGTRLIEDGAIRRLVDFTDLLTFTFSDYEGNAIVPWRDVLTLIVNPRYIEEIGNYHATASNPSITWEGFLRKTQLVESAQFKQTIIDSNSRFTRGLKDIS